MHTIRSIYGEQNKLLLLKSVILSCLQNPFLLLSGITSSLVDKLDQQVNWALKTCFHRKKYDSLKDLRERYQIIPVLAILDIKVACDFWQ